ncbi:MAG: hypothetical protein WAV20_11125 [Blastocatellia bacterium]
MPFVSIQSAPPQRNIDAGEQAFNTVLEPCAGRINESVVASMATALQLELTEVQALIDAGKPVPLARSHTRPESEMIAALVRTCGLRAAVIPDCELRLDKELLRARQVELSEDAIHVVHSGGEMRVDKVEITLTVLGELRNTRVDYTEGISGKGGGPGSVLETSEYRSEETLLDVYATSLDRSFRIRSDAFDYSGLVSPLSFRSDLNFRAALATLRGAVPQALNDDDFTKMRPLLERAWPARTRNESRGIKRTGLGLRAVAQASVSNDNRDQFERYSRLVFISSKREPN